MHPSHPVESPHRMTCCRHQHILKICRNNRSISTCSGNVSMPSTGRTETAKSCPGLPGDNMGRTWTCSGNTSKYGAFLDMSPEHFHAVDLYVRKLLMTEEWAAVQASRSQNTVTNLSLQIAISRLVHAGRRTLPWAFTEHGAMMAFVFSPNGAQYDSLGQRPRYGATNSLALKGWHTLIQRQVSSHFTFPISIFNWRLGYGG